MDCVVRIFLIFNKVLKIVFVLNVDHVRLKVTLHYRSNARSDDA